MFELRVLKERLDRESVIDILSFNGFRVDTRTNMVALTDDDKTPSSLINKDGSVHSFNDSFHGDILDVLQKYRGVSFLNAIEIVNAYFGTTSNDKSPYKPNIEPIKRETSTPKPLYDIKKLHKQYIEAKRGLSKDELYHLGDDLISAKFWNSQKPKRETCKYTGYSNRDRSLTISLFKGKDIQCVTVRKSGGIKWKTYGSKTFIPSYLEDDFIFIASGMSEILLFEFLGWSYLLLQSDSVHKHLEQFREPLKGKVLIILQENDTSSQTLTTNIKAMFPELETVVIDFTQMIDRELPKGYDFRDYCNEIKDAHIVVENIKYEIKRGLEQ